MSGLLSSVGIVEDLDNFIFNRLRDLDRGVFASKGHSNVIVEFVILNEKFVEQLSLVHLKEKK
jgi:hypothetical protein